jgi:hypothetical protein
MDITSFFQEKQPKLSRKKSKKIKKKNIKKDPFIEHLSKFVKDEIIDLLEYTFLIEFYKKHAPLINVSKFCDIIKKIDNNEFKELCKNHFSHVFTNDLTYDSINIAKIVEKAYINTHITYSTDQKKALNKIIKFMIYPDRRTFGLYGYAGTGKTTLIVELVHFLLKYNYVTSVVLTAPTNKAVNIMKAKFRYELKKLIEGKIKNYRSTNSFDDNLDKLQNIGLKVDFMTTHKLLNYQNDFDVDGNRIFVKGKGSNISYYDLVIIDECSMISLDIVANIFNEVKQQNIKSSKVMFVGDPAQLPPVHEENSVIFSDTINLTFTNFEKKIRDKENTNIKEIYNTMKAYIKMQNSFTLTEVVRSDDDKIIGLCNNIRKWVLGSIKAPSIISYKGKGVYLYKYKKMGKHRTKWFKEFLRKKKKDTVGSIILTWTNKQTNEYNNQVRNHIFKHKKKINKYEPGDVLILSEFYNMDEDELKNSSKNNDNNDNKRFYTSEQVKVADVDELVKTQPPFSEILPKEARKIKNYVIIGEKYRKIIQLMNLKTKRKYNIWKLYIHKLTELDENTVPEVFQMYVIKDNSRNDLEMDRDFCIDKIKSIRKFLLNYYPEQINQLDTKIIKPLWKEMNKIFIEPFANVNMGNSITCHKSQGSTFYNIFVDVDDIMRNDRSNEAKRCIYTALTRASNEIHILF